MEYEYWGWVQRFGDGLWTGTQYGLPAGGMAINTVPDWVKTKLAMLDLVGVNQELPCGSYRVGSEPLITYYLYSEREKS